DTRFEHLHRRGDGSAGGDRIHPQVVAEEVGFDHRVQIADARVRAQGPRILVLGPLPGRAQVARVCVYQVLRGAAVQARNAYAGDRAGEAGLVRNQARGFERVTVDLVSMLELPLAEIAGR